MLREEWGFEGLVVSDWGAVHDRVAALRGGLDLEMPPNFGVSDAAVIAAVRDGSLDESILDETSRRVLRLVDRSQPALAEDEPVDFDEHHALARRAAHESAVLLKNAGHVLPLQPERGSMVAVIGEFARTPRYQGAGSSQVNPTRVDVALDELQSALADHAEVRFAAGFGIGNTDDDEQLRQEAVELAREADHVVVFLGLPGEDESEGFDRTHIDLPANQLVMLHAVADVHDRLIVILANGGVVRVVHLGGQGLRDLGMLAIGAGRRRCRGRSCARRRQPVRQTRRNHSGTAARQPVLPELPRRRGCGQVRRRDLHWLSRLRLAHPARQLSVWVRPVLHQFPYRRR